MPLTKKGKTILGHMMEEYHSAKKAKQVFYASRNNGTSKDVEKKR